MYAVVNSSGVATVVSKSMRGAKNYATRKGYKTVCQVGKYSMSCYNFFTKVNNKWEQS